MTASPPILRLEQFEGPLHLLLHLIERHELDVTTISLALVADQYLAAVRSAEHLDADVLADFIVVGAKLLLIKSVALLPARERARQEIDDEIVDPTDLTERLHQYEAFRDVAGTLRGREQDDLRSFPRTVPPPPVPTSLAPDAHRPADLNQALRRVLARALKALPEQSVPRVEVSVPARIGYLRRLAGLGKPISLFDLIAGRPRPYVIATFLAVLELVRLGELAAQQDERFADVVLLASGKDASTEVRADWR